MITAHAGGSLVHGPGYLAEFAPQGVARFLGGKVPGAIDAATAHGDMPVSVATLKNFESDIRPLFSRYCSKCHGDGKQEANFRVDSLVASMTNSMEVHDWERAMNMLNTHQMPPEDARPLPDEARVKIINWIVTAMREEAMSRRTHDAYLQIRRLSKRE
jgi:hypothetical protein